MKRNLIKKIMVLFTAAAVSITLAAGCLAAESGSGLELTMQIGDPVMTVNGTDTEIDPGRGTAPVVLNDRTMIPVRAVIEAMGGEANWDAETQSAVLAYGGSTVMLTVGSTTAYYNDTARTLDTAPVIVNDRTLLPIRFIAESFGFEVGWDGDTQTVTITGGVSAPETPATTAEPAAGDDGDTLMVYFSATGNTETVANYIAEATDADIFVIEPAEPYTSADLNWTDESSRVVMEYEDESLRDIELAVTTPDNWDSYDTVFIGYPIWWGIAAWPVSSFVQANDFTGKTVIPFCTSSSSGLGESGTLLEEAAGTGEWLEGMRFRGSSSQDEVSAWVQSVVGSSENESAEDRGTLVVYFSMPETNDPDNMTTEEANSTVVIDGEVLGNTQYMAYVIAENTGADIFRIEPETPYPTDHDTLVDLAADEQDSAARPAIKDEITNLDEYDTVFLGYPNWWGDMPMILYTFLDEYDLSGKTVIPFNTHGGSGFSSTISTIRSLEPDAEVLDGLSISRNVIQDAEQDIIDWVNSLDI